MCELIHVVDDEGTNEENPHTPPSRSLTRSRVTLDV